VWSRDLGRAAQRHVREHFALDAMVRQYQETYDRAGRSARSAPAAAVGRAGAGGAA
jgi:hypothetical protein